jgi:hypothetical protein
VGCADSTPGAGGTQVAPPGGGPAGAGGTPVAGTGGVPAGGALPCNVETVVASRCQNCHGAALIGGAPMPLLTHADFHRDYAVATTPQLAGQTMKLYDLVRIRINREQGTTPMPQGAPMAEGELAALNQWIAAGAPAGLGCGSMGTAGTGTMAGSGGIGMAGVGAAGVGAAGTGAAGTGGTFGDDWLPPQPGETCYELLTHGGQSLPDGATANDVDPYMVRPGENYEQFYYRTPWTTESRGTRFGARFDNQQVLHHWLLFSSAKPVTMHGTHETVIGTQLGDTAALIAGWAVGGKNVIMPDNVEFQLPPPNTLLNVQWHYYNSTPQPQPDKSGVLVCTVPPGTRQHVGGITWLGTEWFNGPIGMPPGEHQFGGTCLNDSGAPITIFFFWPHMHEIGIHMRSVVQRAAGGMEEVFNMPFDFNYQIHYDANVVLLPGDRITSTCTFRNTTAGNVAFGPSTNQEMCYQFAFSYPVGALDNGVPSLIGATNTCW